MKYLGWSYRADIKTGKNGDFCAELPSENDFEAVFQLSVVMTMVPRLVSLIRRSLKIKKSVANASRVLLFAE